MNRTRTAMIMVSLGLCLVAGQSTSAPAAVPQCFDAADLDFNGDGFDDAVVGDPSATVDGRAQAGRVVVLYGDADGRVGQGGRSMITQADLGLAIEAGDRFGRSVSTAHVDMDSCLDVVVGAPGEDLGGVADAGIVNVVYGSKAGLNGDYASTMLTQGTSGGTSEAGDRFGTAIAAGDNLGTDTSVVAVGTPGEDFGSVADIGVVNVVQFSDTIPVLPRQISQSTSGVPGSSERGDLFGAAVALGVDLINRYGRWDLIVGSPGEAIGSRAGAGAVTVLGDVHDYPPTTYTAASYSQNSPGVPGVAETGDAFGYSVAAGSSSAGHVVVGAPGEAIGSTRTAGMINLFSSDGRGLEPDMGLSQDSAGVGGVTEQGDRFGHAVALLAPSGGNERLAVGTPLEDLGTVTDAGVVQVFPVSNLSADVGYDAGSAGAAGPVQTGGRFGSPLVTILVTISGDQESLFAVGNPYNGSGSVFLISASAAGFANRSWVAGSGGIPGTGAAKFGWSIGGYPSN